MTASWKVAGCLLPCVGFAGWGLLTLLRFLDDADLPEWEGALYKMGWFLLAGGVVLGLWLLALGLAAWFGVNGQPL